MAGDGRSEHPCLLGRSIILGHGWSEPPWGSISILHGWWRGALSGPAARSRSITLGLGWSDSEHFLSAWLVTAALSGPGECSSFLTCVMCGLIGLHWHILCFHRCSEEDAAWCTEGGCCFAELRLIFSCRDHRSRLRQCAFVRWLQSAPDDAYDELQLQRLPWETTRLPTLRSQTRPVPHYDVIEVNRIIKPVFLQRQPSDHSFSFYNDFVWMWLALGSVSWDLPAVLYFK